MTSAFVVLSQPKPKEGQPCNGCGKCCQTQACGLSRQFLDSDVAPCIALEWDGQSRYRCGLVNNPGIYLGTDRAEGADAYFSKAFSALLGIGMGCDSGDPNGGAQ